MTDSGENEFQDPLSNCRNLFEEKNKQTNLCVQLGMADAALHGQRSLEYIHG